MPEVISKKVVAIEHPRQDEPITSNNYTFRIAAMFGVKKVEVSINESGWEPCRQAGDSWWYDWSGYGSGEYELIARVQLNDGHFYATDRRYFTVSLAHGERSPYGGAYRTFSPRPARQHGGRPELGQYMAKQCVVIVPNQPSFLRQLTQLLTMEGVNIDSLLMETYGDVTSFRFLLEKGDSLRSTLESEGFHVVEDKAFQLDLPNCPGQLDRLTQMLADAKIAVRYLYGTSHGETTKVVFLVDRPEDALAVVKEFDQRCAVAA